MIARALVTLALASAATTAAAADKSVFSWKESFAAGYVFFQEIEEHPSQTPAISTAQYAMIVKNKSHDFRICRLHYAEGGKTPVGICEPVARLEDIVRKTN